MNNQQLLTVAGLTIVASSLPSCSTEQANKRPNIVLVTCEDISLYLGCYGDSVAISPNIDRFAKEGITFSQMHTTVGVSAPSRFALISGMYPSAMGANYMRNYCKKPEQYPENLKPYHVILPDEVKGFTEYMRQAGYYCINKGKSDYQFNAPLSLWDGGNRDDCPDGMPLFAMYNLMITHESKIWQESKAPLAVSPEDVVVPPYYPDNEIVRHDIAVMYSNIARMDSQFQGILDDIEARGETDNTIVIFMSDNGGPLPRQKRSIYESGTHVPFIVRFPDGYRAGDTDSRLSMFIDVPATILSLAGVEPPAHMHGEALLGRYAAKEAREYIYAARDRMDEQYDKQGAAKDSHYRYIRNYNPERSNYLGVQYRFNMPLMCNMLELRDKGELNETQMLWFNAPRSCEEFYDDVNDPHSINNLIDNPLYKEDIDRLRSAYDSWVEEYNGRWMLSEQESRDSMLPGDGEQPTLDKPSISSLRGKVVISSNNAGASIVYRVNGKGYNENHWILYTEAIENLNEGDVVTALCTRAGYLNSDIYEYEFHK
ncbi:MAG: sulfatase [Rikenellaceae bacterium]